MEINTFIKYNESWEELSIKKGLSRWANLYDSSDNKNLCSEWIKTYENDSCISMIIITKGGLDIAAILISKNGTSPFYDEVRWSIIKKISSFKTLQNNFL